MKLIKKATFYFKNCFMRKDWIYNRKNAGLSTGTKAMKYLLCAGCRKFNLCYNVAMKQKTNENVLYKLT